MKQATKVDPFVPSAAEAKMAGDASRILAAYIGTRTEVSFELNDENHERGHMILPSSVIKMMQRILTEMSQGNAITIIPLHAELTTQEAADFLNVSRPFVVKQLEAETIPHRKVGTHRRISVQDLIKYKSEMDSNRSKALDELTAEAQRLGLGY